MGSVQLWIFLTARRATGCWQFNRNIYEPTSLNPIEAETTSKEERVKLKRRKSIKNGRREKRFHAHFCFERMTAITMSKQPSVNVSSSPFHFALFPFFSSSSIKLITQSTWRWLQIKFKALNSIFDRTQSAEWDEFARRLLHHLLSWQHNKAHRLFIIPRIPILSRFVASELLNSQWSRRRHACVKIFRKIVDREGIWIKVILRDSILHMLYSYSYLKRSAWVECELSTRNDFPLSATD